jgi:PST family polysaccharide transporter
MLRQIAKNAAWLGVIQALNYAVPIFTLPVVVRAFGPELFGAIAAITAYATYAGLVISYGFSLSGPRIVSRLRDNPSRLSENIGQILLAQSLLGVATTAAFCCLMPILPYSSDNKMVSVIILAKSIAGAIAPQWVFLGLEDMRDFSITQLAPRAMAAAAIVFSVRNPDDLYLYVSLDSGAAVLGALLSFMILFRRGIKWRLPDLRSIFSTLIESGPLFLSTVSMNIYKTTTVLVVALVLGPVAAGSFALAYRLMAAVAQMLGPITAAIYPFICRISVGSETSGEKRTRRLFFGAIIALSASLSVALFVTAPIIISFFGGQKFPNAVVLLRLMAFVPLAGALSNILGMQTMLPLKMDRELTWVVGVTAVVGLAGLVVLSELFGTDGAAVAVLGAEVFVAIGMAVILSTKMRLSSLFATQ